MKQRNETHPSTFTMYLAALCAAATLYAVRALIDAGEKAPFSLRAEAALFGVLTLLCLRSLSFRKTLESTSHGSAGFASTEEIRDLLLGDEATLVPGSVLLGKLGSKRVILPPLLARQHGVIVGGSGTGKSWGLFLPNVAFMQGASCVVTDPKSELWRHTSGFHPSVRYAPTEPFESEGFNWIPLCSDARLSELCARAIVEAGNVERQEPPWPDLEVAFLSALFSHASTLAVPTPLSAYRLFTRMDPATLIETFLSSPSSAAQEQAIIFQQTHERMRGSIVPVIAAKLQFLRDPSVARFTSASYDPPDFGRLRISPEAIYWCVREHDLARLRPLSALFFTLLLEQLAAVKVESDSSIPVSVFLDEFANIGVIPHFDTTISLARGRGVSLWLGIQSLSQLTARYGRANAQTILTNCATKIALSGLDVETAEYFSRSLGQATRKVPRRTWQKKRFALISGAMSDTVQEHARSLLSADEVRRIETNKAIVIVGNRRPMLLEKFVYALPAKTSESPGLGPALSVPVDVSVPPSKPARKTEEPPPIPQELLNRLETKREINSATKRFIKRSTKARGRVTLIVNSQSNPKTLLEKPRNK